MKYQIMILRLEDNKFVPASIWFDSKAFAEMRMRSMQYINPERTYQLVQKG